jgi:hypothetical protein
MLRPDLESQAPRANLDLRLAESYIPALLLSLKFALYSSMVSLLVNLPAHLSLCVASAYLAALYVDHIYLLLPQKNAAFIDTTALSADVVFAHLFMLAAPEGDWGCSAALVLWTALGVLQLLTPQSRAVAHLAAAGCFALFAALNTLAEPAPPRQGTHFYIRALLYGVLALVDAYTLRPPLQLEADRLCACKYGAVLFSQWPLAVALFSTALAAQLLKLHAQHRVPEPPEPAQAEPPSVADLNVMEALRLAKEQYGLTQDHSGKIN